VEDRERLATMQASLSAQRRDQGSFILRNTMSGSARHRRAPSAAESARRTASGVRSAESQEMPPTSRLAVPTWPSGGSACMAMHDWLEAGRSGSAALRYVAPRVMRGPSQAAQARVPSWPPHVASMPPATTDAPAHPGLTPKSAAPVAGARVVAACTPMTSHAGAIGSSVLVDLFQMTRSTSWRFRVSWLLFMTSSGSVLGRDSLTELRACLRWLACFPVPLSTDGPCRLGTGGRRPWRSIRVGPSHQRSVGCIRSP
jgi:hypothetical protein